MRTLSARERKRRVALLMALRRIRGAGTAPECSWCGDPAFEQVLTGWHRPNPEAAPVAHFAWMCERDATDYKNEKEWSRRG